MVYILILNIESHYSYKKREQSFAIYCNYFFVITGVVIFMAVIFMAGFSLFFLARTFSLYSLLAGLALSRIPQHSQPLPSLAIRFILHYQITLLLMARLVRKEDMGPMQVKVGTESKWICMCGLSSNQPFCDGSHKKTADEEAGKIYRYNPDGTRTEVQ